MEHKVEVGNLFEVKLGFWKGKLKIMYCGMPNENTFVLSPYIGSGYQGFSPNVFYRSNSAVIQLLGLPIELVEVSQDHIILREFPEEE